MITGARNKGYMPIATGQSNRSSKPKDISEARHVETAQEKKNMARTDGISLQLISKNGISVDPFQPQAPVDIPKLQVPKNFVVGEDYNGKFNRIIDDIFQKYYQGEADDQAVIETMDNAVSSLIEEYTKLGLNPSEICADQ